MTSRATDLFLEGDHASRPAETDVPVGALYSCTTHDLIYKNEAGTWVTWATLGGSGVVESVVAGTNVTVDNTDPANPVVSATGGGTTDLWTPNLDEPLNTMTGLATPLNGTWSIVSGFLEQTNAAASDANIGWGTATQFPAGVNAAEVETRWNSGSGSLQRMGIFVGGPASGSTGGYALVYLKTSDGTNWVVCEERAGQALIYTSSGFTRTPGTWIRLSALSANGGINLFVDGVQMGSVSAGSSPGSVGTRAMLYAANVNADFRNLKTWDSALNPTSPF